MSDESLKPNYVEKRVRYFDGQYLKVEDFENEQQYHIDRQRRISQFLHVSGILEGLIVSISNKTKLIITRGAAVDDQGRQILLNTEATFNKAVLKPLPQDSFEIDLSDNSTFPRNQSYNLFIIWTEVESDPQSETGSTGNTRNHERPEFLLQPFSLTQPVPAPPAASVFLAVLNGANDDGFTVGISDLRQYSGLKLPAQSGNGVTLRSHNGASDRAVLNGSLRVTENLTVVGTSTLNGNTTIAGTLSTTGTSGNLTVAGTSTLNGNTAIVGTFSITGNSTLNGSLTVNSPAYLKGAQNGIGLTVNPNGNVGIGTNSPAEPLEIQKTGNNHFLSIYNNGTDANQESRIVWKNGSTNNIKLTAAIASRPGTDLNTGDLRFQTARNGTLENRIVLNESGVYENRNPSAYPNYEIYIQGSAMESSEGNTPSFKIKDQTISLSSLPGENRGIYTIILNPDGTSKAQTKHDVFGASNWNTWADWLNINAREGDVVAIASQDALNAVPSTGSAQKLLRSILAESVFEVQQYGIDASVIRRPYVLLFIMGRSGAIEVLQPYGGPNAYIKTTYYDLLQNSNGIKVGSAGNVGIRATAPKIHLAIGDNNTGLQQQGDGKLAIITNGGEQIRVVEDGSVGIGTSYPQAKLHLANGEIRISDSTDYVRIGMSNKKEFYIYKNGDNLGVYMEAGRNKWIEHSDVSLKKDIIPLSNILDKVIKLRPVQFTWKERNTEDFGFIAQEVEKVFPEIVSTSNIDDIPLKGISYTHFGTLAIRAIQELSEKIQDLESKVAELQSENQMK